MRAAPEQQLQRTVASYLDMALPVGCTWFAINPVPVKSKAAAGISKALGLKAGTPDLCILFNGKAGFIELKASTGRLSEAQVHMMQKITDSECHWSVCRSLDEVETVLSRWGIGLKARAA